MSKNKLSKFAEMRQFPNVFQNFEFKDPQLIGAGGVEVDMKGNWGEEHFQNTNPIILELACGRGEYAVALAEKYPKKNFVGVDIKGARMYKGAKKALEEKLANAAFLRCRIEQLEEFFNKEEVAEIWITFPDPFLKRSDANKRLTAPVFLNKYRQILQKGGLIHLKTDSLPLYEYSLKVAKGTNWIKSNENDPNIYNGELSLDDLEIKTNYERMHLNEGKDIKYIQLQVVDPE